ncbi:MAG TPA: rhomboid family intramembrane serine protease [Candidatus Hydrogenedentes bacterium]|nr:rhomboid family intramembrane serine protease [Candidatus Hydrogenedentota bacterium]
MSQYQYYRENIGIAAPRITWAVQRIILLNIAVFVIQLLAAPLEVYLLKKYGVGMGAGGLMNTLFGFQSSLFLRGFVYTPITYQFLHNGLLHLTINMLWLFFFGPDVERTLGTRQFYKFYLLCGGLGVLANMIPYFIPGGASFPVIGASGALMGVLVAFALIDPERQFFLFPFPVPITARWLVIIVIVMNIIIGLSGSPLAIVTNFGGLAVGYAYMKLLPMLNAWQRERHRLAASSKEAQKSPMDKVGEAVDNIFKFEPKDRH